MTVWTELALLFPHVFEAKYGEIGGDGFRAWQRTLKGLTPQQMMRGLAKVRRSGESYPPGPTTFRAYCQRLPSELGLPSPREAYTAAARCQWRHPIIWHAVQGCRAEGMGTFELRTRAEAETWPVFERVYWRLVQEADRGREFELPPEKPALPSRSSVPTDPRFRDLTGEDAIAAMRRIVGRGGA